MAPSDADRLILLFLIFERASSDPAIQTLNNQHNLLDINSHNFNT